MNSWQYPNIKKTYEIKADKKVKWKAKKNGEIPQVHVLYQAHNKFCAIATNLSLMWLS